MRFLSSFDSSNLDAQSTSEPKIPFVEDGNAIAVGFDLVQQSTVVSDGQTVGEPAPRELDGFLFLPSYLESFEALRDGGSPELAYQLLDAIIAYGTEGKRIATAPAVTAVMKSIERTIDSGAKKRAETLRKKQERAAKRKPPLQD